MARAAITRVEAFPQGEDVLLRWTTIFYGAGVSGTDFDNEASVTRTQGMTVTQTKAAIRAAIQQRATALGYGTINGVPQHVDEVFHGL